jgi:hypothetical protein
VPKPSRPPGCGSRRCRRRTWRSCGDAFHSGDADGALAHFDQNVVVDASRARPDGGKGQGREQLNAIVTAWMGTWDEWREEIAEMRDLGSRVLVLSVQHGRGKEAG